MRIRVGIADTIGSLGANRSSGLLILRTDGDLIFISPATLLGPRLSPVARGRMLPGGIPAPMRRAGPSPGIGTLHSDWLTVPSHQARAFSELRGRSVTVEFRRVTASSGAGSPVQVKVRVNDVPARLPAVGTTGITVVQLVRAHGDFDSPLEAQANHFIRTDPSLSNMPGSETVSETYRYITANIEYLRSLAERLAH